MSDRTDIPPLFHSEYDDGPFRECAVCGKSLNEPDCVYSISKTCNQGEAIVEMAVCDDCGDELRDELSDESRAAVTEFVESRLMEAVLEQHATGTTGDDANPRGLLRLLNGPSEPPEDPLDLIATCSLCGKAKDDCRTFSVTAYCVGDEMVVQPTGPLSLGLPAMLCDDCNRAASEKLSKETRETWDKFYNDFIDTPPRITLDGPVPILGM